MNYNQSKQKSTIEKIRERKWRLLTFLLLASILIPIVIFAMLHIKDKGTLIDFWGSYAGGITTLIGVIVTVYSMEREKEETREKEKPFIVPLPQTCYITKFNEEKIKISWKRGSKQPSSLPIINIMNVGKEHALNLQVSLKPIEYSLIEQASEKYDSINIISKERYTEYLNKEIKSNKPTNVIKVSEKDEMYGVILDSVLNDLLINIINTVGMDIDNINLDNLFLHEIPLCELYFGFNNIYENYNYNEYIIYMSINISKNIAKNISNQVNLSFRNKNNS